MPQIGRHKSVNKSVKIKSQEDYGSGGLVPMRLSYVKGLYKTNFVATWMS